MAAYFYAGNDTVGAHVRRILDAAGWFAEDIVEDAEVVITYFTSTTALEDARPRSHVSFLRLPW